MYIIRKTLISMDNRDIPYYDNGGMCGNCLTEDINSAHVYLSLSHADTRLDSLLDFGHPYGGAHIVTVEVQGDSIRIIEE